LPVYPRNEIVKRVAAGQRELRGAVRVGVEVHQVRAMSALDPATEDGRAMLAIRRKTLVCCPACHDRLDPDAFASLPLESRVP
jgi:hypothetical protein